MNIFKMKKLRIFTKVTIVTSLFFAVSSCVDPVEKFKEGEAKEASKDFKGALECYETAADKGYADAQFKVGELLVLGEDITSIPVDSTKAIEMWTKAAEQNYALANNALGTAYEKGFGVQKSLKKALAYYEKAKAQGQALGAVNVGRIYYNANIKTDSIGQDYVKAKQMFQEALDMDSKCGPAYYWLGNIYLNGNGTIVDYNAAVQYFQKGSEIEDTDCMCSYAWHLREGKGIAQNVEKSFYTYKKAAELGSARGLMGIGDAYNFGKGVPTDYQLALKYYQEAANKGLVAAMIQLANMYYYGRGVIKDERKAFEYDLMAAETGDKIAQFNVAYDYEQGNGTPKDKATALDWYKKSADQGYEKAIQAVNRYGW